MPELSQVRTLGGVGSILMVLGLVPLVGWVLGIAGAIMVLLAIKQISEMVEDRSIFNNMIIAIILGIVGIAVVVAVIVGSVLSTMGLGNLSGMFPNGFANGFPGYMPPAVPSGGMFGLIMGALVGLAALWVLLLVSAIFVRRSYESVSRKLGVGMFATTGLIYLIGAALTIVLVGFVLLFVALILNIIAFFSISDQPAAQPSTRPTVPPMTA